MNGPEHYAEAERILATAEVDVSENWPTKTGEHKADLLAAAQVHATLALAAATIDTADHSVGIGNGGAWQESAR